MPQLYCLPKIHKPNTPLRPIVSAVGSATHPLAKYLAKILQNLIGHTEHHIINSTHFIQKLQKVRLDPQDIMVSFDVTSLFTKVPVPEAIRLVRERLQNAGLDANLATLPQLCSTSTFFSFNDNIYEQAEGAAMGSPLSPVLANIYMEAFEENAIQSSRLKPKHWFRYVDDTFVIWPHGRNNLDGFLQHLNSQQNNIRFTMETEDNGAIPFLDVLVTRKNDGSLGHRVYRKPTHTNRYLNAASHHHPAQKQSVINSLIRRAKDISEPAELSQELQNISSTLQKNGYKKKDIDRVIKGKTPQQEKEPKEKDLAVTFLLVLSKS